MGFRSNIETGKQAVWKELEPSYRTGLEAILARVGADCKSVAYSAVYNDSALWVADGLR